MQKNEKRVLLVAGAGTAVLLLMLGMWSLAGVVCVVTGTALVTLTALFRRDSSAEAVAAVASEPEPAPEPESGSQES